MILQIGGLVITPAGYPSEMCCSLKNRRAVMDTVSQPQALQTLSPENVSDIDIQREIKEI